MILKIFFLKNMGNYINKSSSAPKPIPTWSSNIQYQMYQIVSYQGNIYKCRISHKSVEQWAPGIYTQTLWEKQ